jgi:hypothetical protein
MARLRHGCWRGNPVGTGNTNKSSRHTHRIHCARLRPGSAIRHPLSRWCRGRSARIVARPLGSHSEPSGGFYARVSTFTAPVSVQGAGIGHCQQRCSSPTAPAARCRWHGHGPVGSTGLLVRPVDGRSHSVVMCNAKVLVRNTGKSRDHLGFPVDSPHQCRVRQP